MSMYTSQQVCVVYALLMSEDSFILLDALEADEDYIKRAALCVEIGSGSGVVSTFVAMMGGFVVCTDINGHAARATVSTAEQKVVSLNPVLANLLDPFRLTGKVDILCFNPPYVETGEQE